KAQRPRTAHGSGPWRPWHVVSRFAERPEIAAAERLTTPAGQLLALKPRRPVAGAVPEGLHRQPQRGLGHVEKPTAILGSVVQQAALRVQPTVKGRTRERGQDRDLDIEQLACDGKIINLVEHVGTVFIEPDHEAAIDPDPVALDPFDGIQVARSLFALP